MSENEPNMPVNPAQAAPEALKGRYFVLFLLIIVYTLNFLDRQILAILKEPIAAELHLDDRQLGYMGGIFFAAFYSVLAIPAAWLADRYSRVWIMTGALTLWSGFTALCGVATNFLQIGIARAGVGVGEAGGVAPAYSLIADYFPPKQRAMALAIYSFGIPVGSALGILTGGILAKLVDWRFAFISIGIAGLLVAPLLRLLVKDPPRQLKADGSKEKPLGLFGAAKLCFAKPSFWLLSFGAASSSIIGYGFLYWFPTFLTRSLGMTDIVVRSQFYAALLLIGGIIGISLGGFLGDRLGTKSKGAYALVPAIAFIISAPLFYLGVIAKTPHEAFLLFLVPQALALVWLGPVLTAVQHLGPAHSRTMVSSLFLLINNLIGIGIGPLFFGEMSQQLKPIYGAESVKFAFLYGLGFYGLAALLLLLASRQLKKDWVD